jgi:tRNA threonylcarbamoyladenosine modification (KEOPS) complex  Pcc1 subunit
LFNKITSVIYDTMHKVEISIELDAAIRKIVLGSLQPEIGSSVPKTQVNISETNAGLVLSIEGETTSAIRAAMNSYLRWLNCIISISTTIDK